MAGNIYMCYVFIAIWRAAKGAISIDDMRAMTQDREQTLAMGGDICDYWFTGDRQ